MPAAFQVLIVPIIMLGLISSEPDIVLNFSSGFHFHRLIFTLIENIQLNCSLIMKYSIALNFIIQCEKTMPDSLIDYSNASPSYFR